MSLAGIPGTLNTQSVHGRHQVKEPGARQIARAMQQLRTRRDRRLSIRLGQPHHSPANRERLDVGIVDHPVPDPRLVQRGQLRMAGGASTEDADRRACQAGQLSSPGATRGLVTRTISKPALSQTAMPSAPAPAAPPPGWARRRPGTGCSPAGRTAD